MFQPRLPSFAAVLLTFFLLVAREAAGQITPACQSGCVGVEVTPDGGSITQAPNSGPFTAYFFVENTGTMAATYTFTCSRTGGITCGTVTPSSLNMNGFAERSVQVTYSVGSLPGTLRLTATGPDTDQGSYNVNLVGPPQITLHDPNGDNKDRSLCFTAGAGDAAGVACGDLFVTHSMPAYRTLGRDRILSLHYNSALATGLTLVAATVKQPTGIAAPQSIMATLMIGSVGDSASYTWSGSSTTRQVVLGRGITGLATGIYPMTLKVRNIYSTSAHEAVVNGTVLVVSRAQSEFGRGWTTLGVEQVLVDPTDGNRRLWLTGDGSARIYQRGVPISAAMLSQSGLSTFSAANTADHSTSTQGWTTNTSGPGAWLRIDLGAPSAATTMGVYAAAPSLATYNVEYSDNATSWSVAFTGFRATSSGWNWVTWSSVGAHRYWRLRLTNTPGSGPSMNELSLGEGNTFYGAPGQNLDSLVTFSNGSEIWYRRDLERGAEVQFDASGRHRFTYNRARARTEFRWENIGTFGPRLTGVRVPPGTTANRWYVLTWNTTTGRLQSIADPRGRTVTPVYQGDELVRLTDADGRSTRFAYSTNRMTSRVISRRGHKGDSVITTFAYQHSARVTSVAVQVDSAATTTSVTTFVPWDEKGLALGATSQVAAIISDTLGVPTRVDGPFPGSGDAIDAWFDRFGAPRRTLQVGPGTTTSIFRQNRAFPGLVTQVRYPTGRTVTVSHDAIGNVTQTRDSVPAYNQAPSLPTRARTYAYTDTRWPESPTQIADSIGATARVTTYSYNDKGFTEVITDPRQHQTRFAYTGDTLPGLVSSITEVGVETWAEVTGSTDDLTDAPRDQVQQFTYDSIGNLRTAIAPTGVITSYQADNKGRITRIDDALRGRTDRTYDPMNRVLTLTQYSTPQPNVHSLNPIGATCVTDQSTCTENVQAMQASFPATAASRAFYTFGDLDSLLDPRGVRRVYRYDSRGNVRSEEDDYKRRQWTYFGATGVLDSTKSRTGALVQHRYDANGRLDSLIYPKVPRIPGAAFTREVPGDTIVSGYDAVGNLTYRRNRESVVQQLYYADGSLYRKITTIGTYGDTLIYSYDATGARTRLVHGPDIIDYSYAPSTGVLSSITVQWGDGINATRTIQFQWDQLGRRRQITYPAAPYSMTVKYRYDAAGVLRRVISANSYVPAGGAQNRFNFAFRNRGVDPLGRVVGSEIACQGQASPVGNPCGGTDNFVTTQNVFNRMGWLAQQTKGAFTETMQYDHSGNIIVRSGVNGTHHFILDSTLVTGLALPHNRLGKDSVLGATPVSMFYTENGARRGEYESPLDIQDLTNRTYYHDGLGRVVGQRYWIAATLQEKEDSLGCKHDADGRLFKSCAPGAPQLIFDGDNAVKTAGSINWTFVHGPGLDDPLIGLYRGGQGNSRIYYWVTDGQGREFAVADSVGGRSIADNDWQYAGPTRAPDTFNADRQTDGGVRPVSYFRNRAYDQQSGRWTQEDPIGVAGGLNLYQFNGNNPVAYTDPFGLCGRERGNCLQGEDSYKPDPRSKFQSVSGPTGTGGVGVALPAALAPAGNLVKSATPELAGEVYAGPVTAGFDGDNVTLGASPAVGTLGVGVAATFGESPSGTFSGSVGGLFGQGLLGGVSFNKTGSGGVLGVNSFTVRAGIGYNIPGGLGNLFGRIARFFEGSVTQTYGQ